MTLWQQAAVIAAVALGTMCTRFLPFLVFPAHRAVPPYVRYLGRVLPYAVIGLLVVYCLKGVSFTSGWRGLPEALGILCTAGLHLWRKNTLLSIAGGTVCYMLLVQFVLV